MPSSTTPSSANIRLVPFTDAMIRALYPHFTSKELAWRNTNAPYFDDPVYDDPEAFFAGETSFFHSPRVRAVLLDDRVIGSVNAYWEDRKTGWLEVGIVLWEERDWGHGYAKAALAEWIDAMFAAHPTLEHIGLSTWSGNPRMMALAEALGMRQEARIRAVRQLDGTAYDSLSYGVLRKEWRTRREGNLFSEARYSADEEKVHAISYPVHAGEIVFETIASSGQTTDWQDNPFFEHCLLLQGGAVLEIEREEGEVERRKLVPGDVVDLLPHTRHRVAETEVCTLWHCVKWNGSV